MSQNDSAFYRAKSGGDIRVDGSIGWNDDTIVLADTWIISERDDHVVGVEALDSTLAWLDNLKKLTVLQTEALVAGDVERLDSLLDERQSILSQALPFQPSQDNLVFHQQTDLLEAILEMDQQNSAALANLIRETAGEISTLRAGRASARAYRASPPSSPLAAYVDRGA